MHLLSPFSLNLPLYEHKNVPCDPLCKRSFLLQINCIFAQNLYKSDRDRTIGYLGLFHVLLKYQAQLMIKINSHSKRSSVIIKPGRVAQSVTCLATDAYLTADPGVASSIPVRSHTFMEIDHEIISTVILLPSADSFKKGCCQLQAKVCARITG